MNLIGFRMLLGFLMLMPFFGLAQETQLHILDNISKEPIAFANVLITPINSSNNKATGGISNDKGFVRFSIKTKSIIQITYIGYQNITDTVVPGENKVIYLKSISYKVDEVVVTGQYAASTQDKSIYKVSVLNSKEIEQRAAVNIKEMLSNELNIRTKHDGALGSSLTMQGLGGEHIKILIDGVPIIGRENGNIDLEQINLQNVDHIEVINGPMSVVYGSNALAGVINIITKSPDRLLFSTSLDTYYESVGVYNVNATVSARIKRNSFSVTGGRNFFDGYSPSGGEYGYIPFDPDNLEMWWKPKEQWNFTSNYKHKWDNAFVKFGVSWFSEEVRDKGYLLGPYYNYRYDNYFFTQRLVLSADFGYEFSKKSRINAIASVSNYNKKKQRYYNDLTKLELYPVLNQFDTTKFTNTMFRSDYSFGDENSLLKFQTGIDFNNETGYGKRIKDNEQEIGDYAVFASLNYEPIRVLSIQPGLRFIYNTKFEAPIIYSLNVKYDANEYIIIRASLASGFRAPSLKELYLEFVDINHDIHGNENLKAETSITTNALIQYNSSTEQAYVWGLEINIFNNNIKDNIQLIPVANNSGNSNVYTYVNVNRFISRGIEMYFNNNVYPWLTLKFGIAYTGVKIDYSESSDRDFEYYTDYNASLNYWLRKFDINFSIYYKYNGVAPQLYFISVDEEPELRFMAAYQTLDMNFSKWFWKRRLNLQMGAKNLFDNTNIEVSGSQGGGIHTSGNDVALDWGRTFFIRLQFRFNK